MKSLKQRRYDYVFRDPPNFTPVSREEIRGVDIMLGEIEKIVKRIHDFSRFDALGIDIGGGAIFFGPKGTGKTWCSRYVATELRGHARFVDVRGFPRAVVGEREAVLRGEDTRALFELARKYVIKSRKPIIFFYDEFEEVGDEIVEELRLELCGIRERINGIFLLLTSTQDPDSLDERLFRPGRIGDHIQFSFLTRHGQLEVLRHYVEQYPHEFDIDYASLIYLFDEKTTPAVIKQVVNDSYLAACFEGKRGVVRLGKTNLLNQCMRHSLGQPAEEVLGDKDRWIVACHEAGHAVFAYFLGLRVPIVSILPQMDSSIRHGAKAIVPSGDEIVNRKLMENLLVFRFGGMVAEKLFGYHHNLDFEDDIRDITLAAQSMVESLGCGMEIRKKFGHLVLKRSKHEYSDAMRRSLERDTGEIVKNAEKAAGNLVRRIGRKRMKECIRKVASGLLERSILLESEYGELIK